MITYIVAIAGGVIAGVGFAFLVAFLYKLDTEPSTQSSTKEMTPREAIEKLLAEQKAAYEEKLAEKEKELSLQKTQAINSEIEAKAKGELLACKVSNLDHAQAELSRLSVDSDEMAAMVKAFITRFNEKWNAPPPETQDFSWAVRQMQEGKKVRHSDTVYFIDSSSGILKEGTRGYSISSIVYDIRDAQRINTQPDASWWSVVEETADTQL